MATATEGRVEERDPDFSRREIPTEPARQGPSSRGARQFEEVPLHMINPDPGQVRTRKDLQWEAFAEMCSSVGQYGELPPVLVRSGWLSGSYTLISGKCSYRAARQSGLATLPCYVEEAPLDPAGVLLRQLS